VNPSGKASLKRIGSSVAMVGELFRDLLQFPDLTSRLTPDEFMTVMTNLAHGLAVTQRILGAELSQKKARNLIQSLFDGLISST
jgi:hypothetical protein